jgi:hypothetical protein
MIDDNTSQWCFVEVLKYFSLLFRPWHSWQWRSWVLKNVFRISIKIHDEKPFTNCPECNSSSNIYALWTVGTRRANKKAYEEDIGCLSLALFSACLCSRRYRKSIDRGSCFTSNRRYIFHMSLEMVEKLDLLIVIEFKKINKHYNVLMKNCKK